MTAIPEKRPPKAGCHEKSTKEKTLESGSGFLPNVSRKRLLQSIRKEKNTVAGESAAGVPAQERRMQHQGHLQNHGPPYSTMRDWLWRHAGWRIRCRHDKERGRRGCKIPKKVFRAVKRWVKKEPKDFKFESGSWQLNLLLEMIRRHFGLECNARTLRRWLRRIRLSWRKSRHVPVPDCLQNRADGVQGKGRRAGAPDVRGRMRRVYRRRGRSPDAAEPPSTAGGPRADGRRARPRFQRDPSGCLAQCPKTGSSSVSLTRQTRRRSRNF